MSTHAIPLRWGWGWGAGQMSSHTNFHRHGQASMTFSNSQFLKAIGHLFPIKIVSGEGLLLIEWYNFL